MKYYLSSNYNSKPVIKIDDDGTIWWLGRGENDPAYLVWLAEGNTPEEWKPE